MELNKKNVKIILLIITFAVVAFTAAQNYVLVFGVVKKCFSVLKPLFIGLALAFVLNLVMRPIENGYLKLVDKTKKKRGKAAARSVSLIATFLCAFSVVAVVIIAVVPQLKDTFMQLKDAIPGYAETAKEYFTELFVKYNISTDILDKFDIDWGSLIQKLSTKLLSGSGTVISTATGVTASVVGSVSSTFIGFMFCIYILAQKENIGRFCKKVAKAYLPSSTIGRMENVGKIANESFTSFFTTKFIDAMILGGLCLVGMLILRLPYAVASALLIAVFSFVPYVGAFLSAGVSALLIFMESPKKALVFVVFFLVLQFLEGYVIYPRLVGKSFGLPGILVLLSMIIGSSLAGFVGLFIAMPTFSVIFALFKEFIDGRAEKDAVFENVEPLFKE